MTLGHLVRLHCSVFDAGKILDKKRPLMVKKLVLVLLIGQKYFVHRLCYSLEESGQPLFTVLAAHAQLGQYTW